MSYYVANPSEFFFGMEPEERLKQKLIPMIKPRRDQPELQPEALREESEA